MLFWIFDDYDKSELMAFGQCKLHSVDTLNFSSIVLCVYMTILQKVGYWEFEM